MEFKFSCPDEDIVKTLAFAVDKDNNIQIAHGGDLIDTHTMAQILGEAIREVFKNDGTNDDYVDKRDQVHEIIRIFVEALHADLLAANWRKPEDELPTIEKRDVLFILKGRSTGQLSSEGVDEGYYDYIENIFRDNYGIGYKPNAVAYWMPYPEIPIQKAQ